MRPRRVIPGQVVLITRRCTQRQFLLRPDPIVVQTYLYCLAEAAARFEITVYGWVAMSNHHHLLVRDNKGNYPAFLAHFHKMLAKVFNAYRRRRENFWSAEAPSVVHVVQSFDCLMKLVYVLANPVASDLVDRVTDWPGAHSFAHNLTGRVLRVKRPRCFFREEGGMPEEVELRVERLDAYRDLDDDAWRELLAAKVKRAEDAARAERREANRGVMGRKAVLAAAPESRPTTEEERGGLRPSIACRERERRKAERELLREFFAEYQVALEQWRAGDHAVVFPAGTYRMRWYGAATEPFAEAA